ncbi:MAG: hypothetical protein V3S00_06720 [Dehalococcoidia bacterium]
MTQRTPQHRLRSALIGFPERYDLPTRPATAPPAARDAHRQTLFLLAAELELFERSMNLQLRIVSANAKNRTPEGGALLGLWSRTFSLLAEACALMDRGSYVACPPLVRGACDCIAGQRALLADEFAAYSEWLAEGIGQDRQHIALSIDMGRLQPDAVLAEDAVLGPIHRLLTELCLPHFGATALQVGPDSSTKRLALAFASNSFHLGWAELTQGWLLTLAAAQLQTVAGAGVLMVDEEAARELSRLAGDIAETVENPRRCRVEEADGRYLFLNFRRASGRQPRRVIL